MGEFSKIKMELRLARRMYEPVRLEVIRSDRIPISSGDGVTYVRRETPIKSESQYDMRTTQRLGQIVDIEA